MSFQAYLDNMEEKTGKTPNDFVAEAKRKKLTTSKGLSSAPANGFEDRRSGVHNRPSTCTRVRLLTRTLQDCSPSSAVVRHVGRHLGCSGPMRPTNS